MPLLLDTCAAIWIVSGDEISKPARLSLETERQNGEVISVSPITGWEIGLLAARGRFASPYTPRKWFETLLGIEGIELTELSYTALMDSAFLPARPPNDPADRIMIAIARESGFTIVTRDRLILAYAAEGHVRAIAC